MRIRNLTASVGALILALGVVSAPAVARSPQASSPGRTRHVLLISVDGLHQFDVVRCAATGLCPTIARLMAAGTTYANASTSEPSDSSPGIMALVTGATPKLTGVYYDDSYDRTMYQPAAQTASSTQDCSGSAGTETFYAENIDANAPSTANGGVGTRPILNNTIDPTQLSYAKVGGSCVPVWPNDFLRTNSIFSVAHAAGLRTAWADKHPATDQGVSGHGTPNTVDDPFMTEINADIIPASLVDTRGRTVTFPLPNPTANPNGFFITDSVGNTEAYDQIKVDAVLNQIDGETSAGTGHPGTPAIFGMNFQTVSVAQKLVDPILSCARSGNAPTCDPGYVPGGYEPGSLAFTPQLAGAIRSVDAALGSLVAELRAQHLLSSTELIISAKHGQSPLDPAKLAKIGHAENTVIDAAGVTRAQTTDDDIALVWLADQSQTTTAVNALLADQAGANTAHTASVLSGAALEAQFGNPLTDPRTPDLFVEPIAGTIYSKSGAKVAEHGGFAPDDVHVALIVVPGVRLNGQGHGSGRQGTVVGTPVTTTQVAPTILELLGLDPAALDGVKIEGTEVLPAGR